MSRVFLRAHADRGTAELNLSDEEIKSMLGLFSRAGVDAGMIEKISSQQDEVLTEMECRSFSHRIKLILSLRMVLWNEEVPQQVGPPRSVTPKLVSRTIDRPMREKCLQLAEYLSAASMTHGCFIRTEESRPVQERLKNR